MDDETVGKIGCLFMVLFLILGPTAFKDCSCTKDNVGNGAPYAAQTFVKQNLKSPSTAKFGSNPSVRETSKNVFVVKSYVESQNSFGAMIREKYEVTLRNDEEKNSWVLVDIKFY